MIFFSRLLKDRIIMVSDEINDQMANSIVAQLLFLAAEDEKKDISIYINSPGGSTSAGFAIFDTIQFIKPDVCTICTGLAASFGAMLLLSGTKGKRSALPNSEIMLHQPLGEPEGRRQKLIFQQRELSSFGKKINHIIAEHSGQPVEKVAEDTERDYFFKCRRGKRIWVN